MAVKYYHLTNPHANYDGLITAFTAQHKRQWAKANLSVTDFDDGTKLVKVDIADESSAVNAAIITEYDSSEHSDVKTLYMANTPAPEEII